MAIPSQKGQRHRQEEHAQEGEDEGAVTTNTPDTMAAAAAAGTAQGPGETACKEEDNGEQANDTSDPVAMFREFYSVLFEPEEGRGYPCDDDEDDGADEDETPPPSVPPSPMRTPPRCHAEAGAIGSAGTKRQWQSDDNGRERAGRLFQPAAAAGDATTAAPAIGLPNLPEECLQEVAAYLPASDLWPSLALVCRRISHNPTLAPVLLAACPRAGRVGALLRFAEASAAEAAHASTTTTALAPPCQKVGSMGAWSAWLVLC